MSNVWIAKCNANSIQGDNPEEVVVKFGQNFSKRGLLTLSENIREGGMLVFKRGCRMTKGKYADVLKQAQIWEDDRSVSAAVDKNVSPAAFQRSLSYLHQLIENQDLIVDRTDKNGTAIDAHTSNWLFKWSYKSDLIQVYARADKQKPWKRIEQFSVPSQFRAFSVYIAKKLPKYVNIEVTSEEEPKQRRTRTVAGINKAVFHHDDLFWKRELKRAGFDVDKNTTQLVQDLYYEYARSSDNSPVDKADEPEFFDKFIQENRKRIAVMTGSSRRIAAKVITAGDVLSDRVSSIVFGDLKRIRSTIASWKGKMTPEQYKEFVEYQKGIAKFIKEKYVPKLADAYKDKVSKL